MIIGITGTYRAGKGTLSKFLVSKRGFKHYSVSKYIEEYLRERGVKVIGRDELIAGGNEIRKRFGADYIVKELFKKAQAEGGNIVIESIRNPREAQFIKSQPESILIAVDAEPILRYRRSQELKGSKDHVTIQEFLASEMREFSSTDPDEQNLGKCIELSDYRLMNNGPKEDLYLEINRTLAHISFAGKERRG